MKLRILFFCLCSLMANTTHAESCLGHRWYHQATVTDHWALLEHELKPGHYWTVTARDKVATAVALLETKPAKPIPATLAEYLTGPLPPKKPSEHYFLIRGLGYSVSSWRLFVYALDDSVMVGYSYLGPVEKLSVSEIPVVLALPQLPRHVYTGCSGAS